MAAFKVLINVFITNRFDQIHNSTISCLSIFERCIIFQPEKLIVSVGLPAYTAPTFTFSKGAMRATANRWFPRPNVTWTDHNRKVLQATTSMEQNSAGIFSLVSSLPRVNTSETYTLQVQNQVVASISTARITGTLRQKWQRRIGKDR